MTPEQDAQTPMTPKGCRNRDIKIYVQTACWNNRDEAVVRSYDSGFLLATGCGKACPLRWQKWLLR